MKFELAAAAAISTLFAPALATAQQFSGQVSLDFTSIDSGDTQSTDLNGAVETAFGPVGVQLDFSGLKNEDSTNVSSIGLHVFYEITPATAVGVVYYRETWEGDGIYQTFGIEAAHERGPWEFQGFAVREEDAEGGSYETDFVGASARYQLRQNITVGGGYVSFDGSDEGSRVELSGEYEFGNGMSASLTVGSENYTGLDPITTIGLGLTYEFGGGATFDRRDFIGLLPGY